MKIRTARESGLSGGTGRVPDNRVMGSVTMSPRELLQQADPQLFAALAGEEQRQAAGIELIPSETGEEAAAGNAPANRPAPTAEA